MEINREQQWFENVITTAVVTEYLLQDLGVAGKAVLCLITARLTVQPRCGGATALDTEAEDEPWRTPEYPRTEVEPSGGHGLPEKAYRGSFVEGERALAYSTPLSRL